ncbi:MAG: SDR family NAD(P)-dependent oxidoreductase [Hyphomonadaceae bacterium]|nr:SDR family NAD(P)-dependent oxidoreductase [Hyphomonadaceae bacterium]
MVRTVVVTGVSSGIGEAIARDLAANGFKVFGSVRKAEDAKALERDLGEAFKPLIFDIVDQISIADAAALVRNGLNGAPLYGLINNAGAGGGGPLMHQDPAELIACLENLAVGPIMVTQAFLPLLGAQRGFQQPPGRIVNVSSVGGRIGFPFLGSYVAGKHALEGLSDCLRRELRIYGIDVVVVEPGATRTKIWDKAEASEDNRYANTDYGATYAAFIKFFSAEGRRGYEPARVASRVRHALTTPRPRSRYVVTPQHVLNWSVPRILPDRALDALFAARLGLRRL